MALSTRHVVVRGGLQPAEYDQAHTGIGGTGIGIFLAKVSLGQGSYHSKVGCYRYEAEGHDESMDPKHHTFFNRSRRRCRRLGSWAQ